MFTGRNRQFRHRYLLTVPVLSVAALLHAAPARAAVYSYVDWTSADVANGTASGVITLPDQSTVSVTFAAINANDTPGSLYGAQINDAQGTNYWSPSAPFISTEVENPPPTPDILQLSGGLDQVYKVTLSEPIKDPVMAIVSLGQGSVRCTYDFDSPFTIVSQGAGYWGGSATALAALPNNILEGYEGHGTIQFIGTFSTFSWTVPTPETWHGFTFGIRTTERLEPSPGAGGAGAGGGAASDGGADAVGDTGGVGGASPQDDPGALGGAAGSDTTGNGVPSPSGGQSSTDGSPPSAGGEAGAGEERAKTRDDGGCGCSIPRSPLGTSAAASALALLLAAVRRKSRHHRR